MRAILSLLLLFMLFPGMPGESFAESDDNDGSGTEYIIVPFPIYSPETKAAFTLIAMYHLRAGESSKPSTHMAFLAYSQLNQFRAALRSIFSLADERISVSGGVAFADWPDKFFGIGTDNIKDDEESFTARSFDISGAVQYRLKKHFEAGVIVSFRNYDITDIETGGLLETANVLGVDGGNVVGVGPVVTYDSRDDTFSPRGGFFAQLSATMFLDNPGDYSFRRYRVDLRQYLPAGNKSVIAIQEYVNMTRGNIPFQYLSAIGDMGGVSLARGYYSGFFRERDVAALQVEYRTHLWKALGGAVFGSAALIGRDLYAGDAAMRPSAGFGLRYGVGKGTIKLRLDFAAGKDSSGVYFGIMEAF